MALKALAGGSAPALGIFERAGSVFVVAIVFAGVLVLFMDEGSAAAPPRASP